MSTSESAIINRAATEMCERALNAALNDPAVGLTILCTAVLRYTRSLDDVDDDAGPRLIAHLAGLNPAKEAGRA